mmetsp:Transcript_35215/g.52280  ORF Transcript_35215/g.52280 Transcript_35215/m.52280 type:complete len:402 (+) Transcript_35215:349-1554(+)
MQEGLAAEHGREVLRNALEHLLDGSGVAGEGNGHLQTLGRNIAHARFDVVGNPLHEVAGVLVLHVEHLLIDLLGAHAATEEGGSSQVAAMPGVGSAHHVLGIEHLLSQLRHSQGTVLLGATGGQGGEAGHEEVQSGEGDQVHGDLSEIAVQLSGESQASGHSTHGGADQVVQVTVGGGGQLQGPEADVVQSLVVKQEALVSVLDKLVEGQHGVVGLNDSVGHLGAGNDAEGLHDPVGVLLTNLGDQQGSHAGASATAQGVAHLETLQAVAAFGLLSDDIQDGVDQLGTLGVVALGPIVASSGLAEDEVVRAEQLTERTSADAVHGARLQIHQDSSGDISSTSGLVVVDIDPLELQVGVTMVSASRVNAMLVGDDFPELGTDLVSALTALDVNQLTHGVEGG